PTGMRGPTAWWPPIHLEFETLADRRAENIECRKGSRVDSAIGLYSTKGMRKQRRSAGCTIFTCNRHRGAGRRITDRSAPWALRWYTVGCLIADGPSPRAIASLGPCSAC